MSKRITITLTDDECDALEYTAQQERRTARDMAAYLIVKHSTRRPTTMGTLTFTNQPWSPQFTAQNPNTCAAAPGLPIYPKPA